MPLDEEGAKWSCEPCIRGHRSSKCQHFDRLMMKVPKAGRPLAKCPHPKGSCSCERVYAFMVRIPKGSSCLCRPVYQVPANSSETTSLPSNPATPSIASTPASAGRIQKPSRRPSNFQSPSDTVIKALDSELIQSDLNKDIRFSRQATGSDSSTNYNPTPGPSGRISNQTGTNDQAQAIPKTSLSETKPGGCCGGKSAPVTPAPQQRSCCDPPSFDELEKQGIAASDSVFKPAWTGLNNPGGLLWNTHLPNNNYPFENNTYPTIKPKSPPFQNQSQSSQPAPPQSFHSNTDYQISRGAPSMDQFYLNSSTYPFNTPLSFANENNHDCSCGDGCQCLGCASHPFNETTRQHVQEMGYMMTVKEHDDTSNTPSPFAGAKSPPALTAKAGPSHNQPVSSNTAQPLTDDTGLLPSFDSTLGSPTFASNQFMQPSEYYTLEYPVGFNACSDTTGTCQCGNDCSCVGCLTHSGHDGLILDSMPAEGQQRPAEGALRQYLSQSTDIPRSMDQYSPSALSPPVVETPLV